jgi:hypothetical protein
MKHSINHPEAIQDKFVERYGNTWANMDFVFDIRISEDGFREDPLNTEIGHLILENQRIKMRYKDLITYSRHIEELSAEVYSNSLSKSDTVNVEVKGSSFSLRKHEIGKLADTLTDAASSTIKGYELGLYL